MPNYCINSGMAYDFIPESTADIKKAGGFGAEYESVYDFLSTKYNRKDPIALSKKANEKRMIKVSRGLQSVTTIQDIQKEVKLQNVKMSFGEGSRGGRGVANKGGQFEIDFTKDLDTWWRGDGQYINPHSEKIINEMSTQYKWDKAKTFKVDNLGGLNQRRSLIFQGAQPYIGTSADPNIGATVTDITVTADKKPVYLSLKATGTVTFFNSGVTKYLPQTEMKEHGTIRNKEGLALLKMLGLNPRQLAAVFNSYGGKLLRKQENVFTKMDMNKMIKFLQSGIGYGFHYVHAKKPTEIHHFNMTRAMMVKLAKPTSAIAYYGGKTSAGKRVDIDIDTPNIKLKINIRNKQGGVYPSHIMCDYIFKSYK